MKNINNKNTKYEEGFSLIELMVAMAISLALVAIASYAYLGSKQSYRVNEEQAQLHEEGRYALDLIGRNIKLAGFSPYVEPLKNNTPTPFNIDGPLLAGQGTTLIAIKGCDGGFNKTTRTCSPSQAGESDAFFVSYITENPASNNNSDQGIGVDCMGNLATETEMVNGSKLYLVTNWFFVNSAAYRLNGQNRTLYQLSCLGNSPNAPSQPILKGVKDLQILYGIITSDIDQSVGQFLNASQVTAANKWDKVASAQVCVLMETLSKNISATSNATTVYTDCEGNTKNQVNGYVTRSFTATYNLRNRVTR